MKGSKDPPLPKPGSAVPTACRGTILYENGTPSAIFRGRRVYFCMKSCLKAFQEDPRTSCLAAEFYQDPD
jgi:YHS domain-containing protein